MSASNDEPIFKIHSEITSKTYRFDYQLLIDKYLIHLNGFRSDQFSPPGLNEPKFCIELSSKPPPSNRSKLISLFVFQNHSNVYVKFTISGLDENGRQQFSNASSQFFQLSKSILLCEFENSRGIYGNKLKIECEFTFEIDTFETQTLLPSLESSNSTKVKVFQCYPSLSQDRQTALDVDNLLKIGKFSDIEIVIGKRSFHAHKLILAPRSPVFAAMFEHDFEENRSNRVEIIDVDEETFEHLLRFIYAHICPPNDSNFEKIFVAADKYQLNALKDIFEKRLEGKLSETTMYDLLLFADAYNADKLKAAAINYISSRFTDGITPYGNKSNPIQNSAITKLFQNHLSSNLIEAMRSFDGDVKSKGINLKNN